MLYAFTGIYNTIFLDISGMSFIRSEQLTVGWIGTCIFLEGSWSTL